MYQRPTTEADVAYQKMGIGITREEHGLEEDQRHRPHRRGAPKLGQRHLREHRLHRKHQQGAGEQRGAEQQGDGALIAQIPALTLRSDSFHRSPCFYPGLYLLTIMALAEVKPQGESMILRGFLSTCLAPQR